MNSNTGQTPAGWARLGPFRRFTVSVVLGTLFALPGAAPARAQVLDTLADTLSRDTVDYTARYLRALGEVNVRFPVLPLIGADGPQPPMSRVVLNRDSIDWVNAETVADLLQRVPGVYLWRGGWIGRPEDPNYQARGPTSVQYEFDGLPYLPLGPDSVGVDPSLLPLSLLERVEIERWPGLLRVHLFTRRNDSRAPASRIGVAAGDRNIRRYSGALDRRYTSGFGFGLGFENLDAPTATGSSSAYDNTHYWGQLSYVPSTRFGLNAQMLLMKPRRDPYVVDADTIGAGLSGSRSDVELRLFLRRRSDDSGPRVDVLFGRTRWNGTGVKDGVDQGGLLVSWRSPTFHAGGSAFTRSRRTPLDFHAEAGWAPVEAFSAGADAGYQTHDGGRHSAWLGVRSGFRLPLGLELTGTLRHGSIVAAPSIRKDPAQRLTDASAVIGWQRPFGGFEVGYTRTDAFRPLPYQPFLRIDSIAPSSPTNWLTLSARVSPKSWLTLESWYSNPAGRDPEGLPPTHSITSATIRSKFWRSFPSGIFDFKLQGTMEAWGSGVIGHDSLGAAIPLAGATFFRMLLEIQLQSFIIYWDRTNLQASRKTYVPGFRMLSFGSTFGVRWEFRN